MDTLNHIGTVPSGYTLHPHQPVCMEGHVWFLYRKDVRVVSQVLVEWLISGCGKGVAQCCRHNVHYVTAGSRGNPIDHWQYSRGKLTLLTTGSTVEGN